LRSGEFRPAALPGSDVLAYARKLESRKLESTKQQSFVGSTLVGVLWAGADQVLHHRVFAPTMGWLPATPLAYLATAAAFAGAWHGTRFRDTDAGIGHKVIRKIVGRTNHTLCGMQLLFTDGTSTSWRGSGTSGDRQEFALTEGGVRVDLFAYY
jgi:hypothetical protein